MLLLLILAVSVMINAQNKQQPGQSRTVQAFKLRLAWYQFIDTGGMEGLVSLGGISEQRTWNRMYAAAGAFYIVPYH